MQSLPVPPRRADDATVTRRALAVYWSRRESLDAREALDATVPAVASLHRREPDAVRRLLFAHLSQSEQALVWDAARTAVVVTVASAPEPVAQSHDDNAREAMEVALDALHAAADAADATGDDGAHRRALASMRHLLRALRALDGVAR